MENLFPILPAECGKNMNRHDAKKESVVFVGELDSWRPCLPAMLHLLAGRFNLPFTRRFFRNLRVQSCHFVLAFAMIFSLILLDCKKDESPTQTATGSIPSELAATWTAQSAFVNGNPALLSAALDWRTGTVRATFAFTTAGALTYTEYSSSNAPLQVTTGTIAVNGSSATMKFLTDNGQPIDPPKELVSAWTVTGNQLNLTWTDSQGTVALQLSK